MKISIRRILLPTDFGEDAKEAQLYATSLAEYFDAELHLLHVLPPATPYFVAESPCLPEENAMQHRVSAVENRLATEIDSQWSQAHRLQRVVVVGFTYDEIVKYAEEHEIDLIVVGTHEHSGLYHLMIGSMAEKLVRLGNIPILTVNSHGHQLGVDSAANKAAATIG